MIQDLPDTLDGAVAEERRLTAEMDRLRDEWEQYTRTAPRPDETQTSHWFEYEWRARVYYAPYTDDITALVAQKIASGEIAIGRPPGFQRYDADGRAIILTPPAMELRRRTAEHNASWRAVADRWSACLDLIRTLRRAHLCIQHGLIYARSVKTKTALRRILKEFINVPWTLELPYCCAGFPCYEMEQYEAENQKPGNNRALRIHYRGRTLILARIRLISGPSGNIWGMQDAGPQLVLLSDDPIKCLGIADRPTFRVRAAELLIEEATKPKA